MDFLLPGPRVPPPTVPVTETETDPVNDAESEPKFQMFGGSIAGGSVHRPIMRWSTAPPQQRRTSAIEIATQWLTSDSDDDLDLSPNRETSNQTNSPGKGQHGGRDYQSTTPRRLAGVAENEEHQEGEGEGEGEGEQADAAGEPHGTNLNAPPPRILRDKIHSVGSGWVDNRDAFEKATLDLEGHQVAWLGTNGRGTKLQEALGVPIEFDEKGHVVLSKQKKGLDYMTGDVRPRLLSHVDGRVDTSSRRMVGSGTKKVTTAVPATTSNTMPDEDNNTMRSGGDGGGKPTSRGSSRPVSPTVKIHESHPRRRGRGKGRPLTEREMARRIKEEVRAKEELLFSKVASARGNSVKQPIDILRDVDALHSIKESEGKRTKNDRRRRFESSMDEYVTLSSLPLVTYLSFLTHTTICYVVL